MIRILVCFFAALVGAEFDNTSFVNNGSCQIEDNNLERWKDSDRVEVYLGEYAMQHVGLSAWLGFSTTHMAVVFQNSRNNKWYVMDSFARSAETIANIVMPSIPPNSPWNSMDWWEKLVTYFRGGVVDYLVWDNAGFVRLREDRTDEFHNLEHLGAIHGAQLKSLRSWVIDEYTKQTEDNPFTFDMWQVYNASTNERIRKSRMCHDFVEDVLGRINFIDTHLDDELTLSASLHGASASVSTYRDSLNLNITRWELIDMTNRKNRRDYQRFLRFFRNHIYEATRDMGYSRVTVTKLVTLGLPLINPLDGNKYYRLSLAELGAFNYCRMPMDFVKGQPYVAAKLDDPRKTCALPHYVYDEFKDVVKFTFSDYLIWAEQKLDDAIFGKNGEGGDPWLHARFVIETTVVLIALAKLLKWLSQKKTGPTSQ